MNVNDPKEFIEIDDANNFFENIGKVWESKNSLIMVRKLSNNDVLKIMPDMEKELTDSGIVEDKSGFVYPNPETIEGQSKILKYRSFKKYIKNEYTLKDTDKDKNEEEELIYMPDEKGEPKTFYKVERTYLKIGEKNIQEDVSEEDRKRKFRYYCMVVLVDITSHMKEIMNLSLDSTTGVPRKELLRPMLAEYIAEAIEQHESFAVTMLDADFFKKVNDTHGHDVGDEVLKALAQYVNKSIRHGDIANANIDSKIKASTTANTINRFGGEEFVIVLKNINFENAIARNEEICKGIKENLKNIGEHEINLTCSMGMAFVNYDTIKDIDIGKTEKLEKLAGRIIKAADNQMYISKNTGRNKVTVVEFSIDKENINQNGKDKNKNKNRDRDDDER